MRTVFMGTPDFAVGTLEALLDAGHEVAAVVTQPDKPKGRGKNMQASPVKEAALAHDLPVLQPKRVREEAFLQQMEEIAPEVIVVVAFGQIIPKRLLDLPRYGCLNVHASLLPEYRGAAPIQWAVVDGRKKSGVTIMQMNEGLDTGDILAVCETELTPDETGGSLFDRLSSMGAELLVKTLPKLGTGELTPVPQPAESPNAYARMITKQDGRIDWTADASSIERLIRGMNPWPSAYTGRKGKMLKIWRAGVRSEDSSAAPGTVCQAGKDGLIVQTGRGQLQILELQAEGKKRMTADAFLRGNAVEPGEILG